MNRLIWYSHVNGNSWDEFIEKCLPRKTIFIALSGIRIIFNIYDWDETEKCISFVRIREKFLVISWGRWNHDCSNVIISLYCDKKILFSWRCEMERIILDLVIDCDSLFTCNILLGTYGAYQTLRLIVFPGIILNLSENL